MRNGRSLSRLFRKPKNGVTVGADRKSQLVRFSKVFYGFSERGHPGAICRRAFHRIKPAIAGFNIGERGGVSGASCRTWLILSMWAEAKKRSLTEATSLPSEEELLWDVVEQDEQPK